MKSFPWNEDHDIYIWDLQRLHDLFEYPIGAKAYYKFLMADEGTIDAPMFQAGDELTEFED